MSVKWSKSYPEAANRFAVSIVDEDSPSGFSWASKTDAEVKSLLGINYNVFYQGIMIFMAQTIINVNYPISSFSNITAFTSSQWTRTGVGTYTNTLNGTLGNYGIFNSGSILDLTSGTKCGSFYFSKPSVESATIQLFLFDANGNLADIDASGNNFSLEIKYPIL